MDPTIPTNFPKKQREKITKLFKIHTGIKNKEKKSIRQKESLIRKNYTISNLHRRKVKVSDMIKATKLKHPKTNQELLRTMKNIAEP